MSLFTKNQSATPFTTHSMQHYTLRPHNSPPNRNEMLFILAGTLISPSTPACSDSRRLDRTLDLGNELISK